jgi:hypothetical protein
MFLAILSSKMYLLLLFHSVKSYAYLMLFSKKKVQKNDEEILGKFVGKTRSEKIYVFYVIDYS